MTSTVSCSAILVEKSSSESSITSFSAASDKQINEHRKVTFNTYILATPHNSVAYAEYKRKYNETWLTPGEISQHSFICKLCVVVR